MRDCFLAIVLNLIALGCVVAQTPAQQGRSNPSNVNQSEGWNTVPNSNPGRVQSIPVANLGAIPQATQPNTDVRPMQPEWLASLTPQEYDFIGRLLDFWQQNSDRINQYQCDFARYDYDTKTCNWRDPESNQLAAASIMYGEIRFAAPDKASYETSEVRAFGLNKQTGKPDYQVQSGDSFREKWICDGKSIFEYDYANKRLYETAIPEEMQGNGLVNSPIPFMFGARKEDILNRFWVRMVTPNGVQDEYWLEAVPKKIEDARNYKKVQVVISREDFLPRMLHIFSPNYDPKLNVMTSRVFEFKNRRINSGTAMVRDFLGTFVRPKKPYGWEWIERKVAQSDSQPFERPGDNRPAQLPSGNTIK